MLIGAGLLLIVVGALLLFAGRVGLPLGRLPGDITYRSSRFTLFAPIGTSILISVILSLIFYFLSRFHR